MYTKLEVLPDVTGAIGSGSLLMVGTAGLGPRNNGKI